MNRQIFVNLPVKDLNKSMAFFTSLGFTFNPQYTDETAACMVVSDVIYVMLLTHEKFAEFTPHPICDASKSTEVLNCLTCASQQEMDTLIEKALAAGGRRHSKPKDYGFMSQDGFQDLDGHIWELVYMKADIPQST